MRTKPFLVLLSATCLILIIIQSRHRYLSAQFFVSQDEQFSCPKWERWRDNYRQCMIDKLTSVLPQQVSDRWKQILQECLLAGNISNINQQFRLETFSNLDEEKITLRSTVDLEQQPCTLVTLGIGGDVKSELAFKAKYPNCIFYGADPVAEYRDIYEPLGKFFPVAVGDSNGFMNATIRLADKGNPYVLRSVPAVDLATFFLQYVKNTVIDHLWMDTEGPEYRLLPLFVKGGMLDQGKITLCQLNTELHTPFQQYGTTAEKYGQMILDFEKNSNFLLFNLVIPVMHQRPFFFNAYDPYCIRRYFGDWCTS